MNSATVYESDGGVPALPVNGVDLDDYGITVMKAQYQDQADMAVEGLPRGNFGGLITQTPRLKAKYLNLVLLLSGSSPQDKQSKMDSLKALIDPRRGELFWVLDREVFGDDSVDRGFWARLHAPIQSDEAGVHNRKFQLNLIVPDGVGYTVEAVTQEETIDDDPFTFTVPEVPGTSPARPVFTLTNTDSLPIQPLSLEVVSEIFGETVTQTLNWTGVLLPDGKIRIDCDRQTIETSDDDGLTWDYAMGWLGGGNPFPLFGSGVTSEVTITGFVAGTVEITYFGEFL